MTVNPTDKFLVNRSGSSYHVEQQDLMAQLEDDDLLLVNRNSKSYKITGAEFKGSLSSPPVIQSVTLTEDDSDGARFTSQDFTTTAVMVDNGNPASTKSIRGWVEGSLTEKIETDEIIFTELVNASLFIARVAPQSFVNANSGGFADALTLTSTTESFPYTHSFTDVDVDYWFIIENAYEVTVQGSGLTDDDSYTRTPAKFCCTIPTRTSQDQLPCHRLDNGEAPDTALPEP